MRTLFIYAFLVGAIGCAENTPEPSTPSAPSRIASIKEPLRDSTSAYASTSPTIDPSRVLVMQTTKLDRYAEVIGVVDVHEAMGIEQAALMALRERAAAMGADAVIGVEFHHGEADGEPTHLSGMAVRFVPRSSLPRE